jgi:nitrogen fixation protein NifU and related proteins
MDIAQLYQDFILKKSQDDAFFEKRPMAQHILEAYNPMCGDKFKLYIDIEDNVIKNATFHGYGCAISKAATAVLIEKIKGKTVENALFSIKTYFEVLNTVERSEIPQACGEVPLPDNMDKDLTPFEVMKQFPERMSCATLSWQAAYDFLITTNS